MTNSRLLARCIGYLIMGIVAFNVSMWIGEQAALGIAATALMCGGVTTAGIWLVQSLLPKNGSN